MNKIIKILRNLILAPFIIYIYNLIASPLDLMIPLNIFTIAIVALLGFSGLLTLLLFLLVAF